jgi:hypothetical protein
MQGSLLFDFAKRYAEARARLAGDDESVGEAVDRAHAGSHGGELDVGRIAQRCHGLPRPGAVDPVRVGRDRARRRNRHVGDQGGCLRQLAQPWRLCPLGSRHPRPGRDGQALCAVHHEPGLAIASQTRRWAATMSSRTGCAKLE